MGVDDAIKAVLGSVEGKLIDAGYAEAAHDPALLAAIEATVRARLAPPPAPNAAGSPPPQAPVLDDAVKMHLNDIVQLLQLEKAMPDSVESYCSVFLGAGAHYRPPAYPPSGGGTWPTYDETKLPPVGPKLAEDLAALCGFRQKFPNEYAGDWMRVSTWHELEKNRDGPIGLEGRIRAAVETNKHGTLMVEQIAQWPCRTFYTTNYDSHLERELLKHNSEIFVWIYEPMPIGDTAYDLRTHWWRMTRAQPELVRWTETAVPPGTGEQPKEPPPAAKVVFKLHGDVRRPGSVVITDDDYIKFLRRIANKDKLPRRLLLPLASHMVFIGYSLRDYNMRYILTMLREERDMGWSAGGQRQSFSVDLRPDPLLKATWEERFRFIKFIQHNLWDVVPEITRQV